MIRFIVSIVLIVLSFFLACCTAKVNHIKSNPHLTTTWEQTKQAYIYNSEEEKKKEKLIWITSKK